MKIGLILPAFFTISLTLLTVIFAIIGYENQVKLTCDKAYENCLMLKYKLETNGFITDDYLQQNVAELDQTAGMLNGRIMVLDDILNVLYDSYRLEESSSGKTNNTIISEEAVRALSGNENLYRHKNEYYEMIMPVKNDKNIIGVFIARISLKSEVNNLSNLLLVLVSVEIFTIIAFIVFAFVFGTRTARPIREMSSAIDEINESNLEAKIPERGYREMSELATAFNGMFERMTKLDESRGRFVSDVSHELKTPMTSIKILADSLLSEEEGLPEDVYREFLTDISTEIDRENQIINDLLELVREEQKKEELKIASVNIDKMVGGIVKRIIPIAHKSGITMYYDCFRNFNADVDEVKLSLALSNLIENAVKYNRENGWVRVSVDCDHKFFTIVIADSGIGIPAEDQEHVFDRFYRVDKARSRATGGTGLGLAIVKNVVFAHKGNINLVSVVDSGSTFTIRIPLVYAGIPVSSGGES